MREALLWTGRDDGTVVCALCAHRCTIAQGRTGRCAVRRNDGGRLVSLNYGTTVAMNVDPIEKKPLFHFLPGTTAYSVASMGCNFRCRFCQNHDISQGPRETGEILGRALTPAEAVAQARTAGCPTIAHTYTEPTVYMEWALETARLSREAGLRTVFVTNGFMTGEALELILPFLDAANVDLKAYSDETYREVIGGRLQPVLDTIEAMHRGGVLVEVTTLVIPGMNDSDDELRRIARFIAGVHPAIPWHVSRFHPDYEMLDRPPTPTRTIQRARRIGLAEGLHHVYCGNLPGDDGESTSCHGCGAMLVRRWGYRVVENRLEGTRCPDCGLEQHLVPA